MSPDVSEDLSWGTMSQNSISNSMAAKREKGFRTSLPRLSASFRWDPQGTPKLAIYIVSSPDDVFPRRTALWLSCTTKQERSQETSHLPSAPACARAGNRLVCGCTSEVSAGIPRRYGREAGQQSAAGLGHLMAKALQVKGTATLAALRGG